MTEKEKIESHIAMCKCCLLAQTMKDCPRCLFNIGLAVQVELPEPRPISIEILVTQLTIAA